MKLNLDMMVTFDQRIKYYTGKMLKNGKSQCKPMNQTEHERQKR